MVENSSTTSPTTADPANDDAPPPKDAISFTDLCAAMGEPEDVVLQSLADILNRRGLPPELRDDRPRDPLTGDLL